MNGRAWVRDGSESHEKPGHELSSSVPSTKSVFQRSGPGIQLFSHKRHLGHMNRRVLELTGHRRQANNWGLFELKCDPSESRPPIVEEPAP